MSEPFLEDKTALLLLDAFKRQPHEPAHLGALRDRLDEIERQDLLGAIALFNETWQNNVRARKTSLSRRAYARWLKTHKAHVGILIPEIPF